MEIIMAVIQDDNGDFSTGYIVSGYCMGEDSTINVQDENGIEREVTGTLQEIL